MDRLLALTLLLVLPAGPASAQDDPACAKDAAALCASAPRGPERFRCLERSEKKLSKACRDQLARMRDAGRKFREDCRDDAEKSCPGLDGHELIACLEGQPFLQASCAQALAPLARRDEHERIEAACKDDAQTLCSGVRPGGHRIGDCLKEHAAQLHKDCREAVESREPKQGAP